VPVRATRPKVLYVELSRKDQEALAKLERANDRRISRSEILRELVRQAAAALTSDREPHRA
jgi:hypothetical protein